MRDPESPEGSQRSTVQSEAAELPLRSVSSEEVKALEGKLDAPIPREREADLSILGIEEIRCEAEREVVRRRRSQRKTEEVADEREGATQSVERWVQIVLLGLLVYVAVVATAVVILGACRGNAGMAQIGVAPLTAVGGLGMYRLPLLLGRR